MDEIDKHVGGAFVMYTMLDDTVCDRRKKYCSWNTGGISDINKV